MKAEGVANYHPRVVSLEAQFNKLPPLQKVETHYYAVYVRQMYLYHEKNCLHATAATVNTT